MIPQSGSAGLISRYRAVAASKGTFDGYVFDVSTNGTYTLTVNRGGTAADTQSGQRLLAAPRRAVLAAGHVPFSRRDLAHPVAVGQRHRHHRQRRRHTGGLGDRHDADRRDAGDRGRRLVPGLLLQPQRHQPVTGAGTCTRPVILPCSTSRARRRSSSPGGWLTIEG